MKSSEIFDAIEEIAATSSKKEKEALVRKYGADVDFMMVLKAALDPFATYGVSKIPDNETHGDCEFDGETWGLLDNLAARVLTGSAAHRDIQAELRDLNPKSGAVFRRIIKRDLRAGFTAGTVNRVFPGAIQTFDCMLAHPFDEKRIKEWPVFVEPKLDGVRVLAFVFLSSTPTVKFYSRSGKEFTAFDHLKTPLVAALAEYFGPGSEWVVDCEIVSGSFNKTVSEVRKKTEAAKDAYLVAFDLLTREGFESTDESAWCDCEPYQRRRQGMQNILPMVSPEELASAASKPFNLCGAGLAGKVVMSPHFQARDVSQIYSLYDRFRAMGLEGAMAKAPNARYRRDRDYAWMKLKGQKSADAPVIGAEPGEEGKKYAGTLGAIVIDYKGVPVRVSGMSDKARDALWQAWLADQRNPDAEEKQILGRLVEVEFHEETPDGSLRHPRFKRVRDDKLAE